MSRGGQVGKKGTYVHCFQLCNMYVISSKICFAKLLLSFPLFTRFFNWLDDLVTIIRRQQIVGLPNVLMANVVWCLSFLIMIAI